MHGAVLTAPKLAKTPSLIASAPTFLRSGDALQPECILRLRAGQGLAKETGYRTKLLPTEVDCRPPVWSRRLGLVRPLRHRRRVSFFSLTARTHLNGNRDISINLLRNA